MTCGNRIVREKKMGGFRARARGHFPLTLVQWDVHNNNEGTSQPVVANSVTSRGLIFHLPVVAFVPKSGNITFHLNVT